MNYNSKHEGAVTSKKISCEIRAYKRLQPLFYVLVNKKSLSHRLGKERNGRFKQKYA